MTDSIKVWVAVNSAEQPTEHISFVSGDAALLMAAEWHGVSPDVDTIKMMKDRGWMVQPYTLTHGHKE